MWHTDLGSIGNSEEEVVVSDGTKYPGQEVASIIDRLQIGIGWVRTSGNVSTSRVDRDGFRSLPVDSEDFSKVCSGVWRRSSLGHIGKI